jgi:threonine synthase
MESDTIAEGVRVSAPVRGEAILREIAGGRGRIMQVHEIDLLNAYNDLARIGFFIEPTSALPWAVLPEIIRNVPDPVVVILTGAGFKSKP